VGGKGRRGKGGRDKTGGSSGKGAFTLSKKSLTSVGSLKTQKKKACLRPIPTLTREKRRGKSKKHKEKGGGEVSSSGVSALAGLGSTREATRLKGTIVIKKRQTGNAAGKALIKRASTKTVVSKDRMNRREKKKDSKTCAGGATPTGKKKRSFEEGNQNCFLSAKWTEGGTKGEQQQNRKK